MAKYLKDLSAAIARGEYDHALDTVHKRVAKAIRDRRTELAFEVLDGLSVGQHVRVLKGNFKPRYFAGLTGRITQFQGEIVWIELDKPPKRPTKTLSGIGVPALWVEALND